MTEKSARIQVEGQSLKWPEGVPRGADFAELARNDVCVLGELVHRKGKAQVTWSTDGEILSVRYFDADGLAHGLEMSRHIDGTAWQVPWVHGHMHGFARQFDESGRELFRTRFVRGSGIDIWVNGDQVAELREHKDNLLHGVERWGHPLLPHEEGHFIRGRRAGILRRWIGSALEMGYPKYFVDDKEVSRDEYVRARKTNPELPADRRKDDRRERPMHPGLLKAWLRKEIRANLMRAPRPEERIGCGAPVVNG